MILATLACGVFDTGPAVSSNRVIIQTRLPTLTPTANSVAVTEEAVNETATPTPIQSPQSINSSTTQVAAEATPLLSPTSTSASAPQTATKKSQAPDAGNTSAATHSVPATDVALADPTNTPTGTATATATATEEPTATHTPAPTATAEPQINTPGWDIAGIRLSTDQYEDRVLLYGELINNTGSAQELAFISGTFQNAEGQLISNPESIIDSWPIDVVPPGGQMPFGLTILSAQNVANINLSVEAVPSNRSLRQDFDVSDVEQWTDEAGSYCIKGNIRNSGDALQEYLVVVAILYDSQGNVIAFVDEGGPPPSMRGDDTLSFVICDQVFNQEISRYELRTWGR